MRWFKSIFSKHNSQVSEDTDRNLLVFQNQINYQFSDYTLLTTALTHRSFNETGNRSYERLEFLGDAVLELIISEYLYNEYPDLTEGELSKRRALLVNKDTLHRYAVNLNLGQYIRVSDSVDLKNIPTQKGLYSDIMEALIGAIYLDGGLQSAKDFIYNFMLFDHLEQKRFSTFNFKGQLYEFCQKNNLSGPRFKVHKVEGPDHRPLYTIGVYINDNCLGIGQGYSKKMAEQNASARALKILRNKKSRR